MTEHTPEPWFWDAGDHGIDSSQPYCHVYVDDETTITTDISATNARRIVACVNACKGIETETLEGGRDEWLCQFLKDVGKHVAGKE